MSQKEIKEEKEKRFLEKSKESLFKLVDVVDNLPGHHS